MIQSYDEKLVNPHIPWKKSLRFRLTILIAIVSIITGAIMMLFLSQVYQSSIDNEFKNIVLSTVGLIIALGLLASVLLNLYIINKFVISPIRKISRDVTEYIPDINRQLIFRPSQPSLRYGDELEALERVIIEMESQVYFSMEAERRASSVKNAFLANMSHELRTPLNSTINMIKEALISTEENTRNEALHQAFASSNDLLSVLNTILEISNIESGRLVLSKSPFVIGKVVLDINSLISILCKAKGIAWEPLINLPASLALEGDRIRLMQVLAIMLRNAVKFASEENGRVTFSLDLLEDTGERACLRFQVSDNGIGMTGKMLEELEQIFASGNDEIIYSSNEIMLSACSRIVKAMGAQIDVKSIPGEGSCFTFVINLPKVTMPPQPEESELSNPDFAKKRVLIVDDVKVNRLVLKNILAQTGMEIAEANDGREAVDFFLAESDSLDLILMDIMMPKMDGYEAAQQIRASGMTKGQTIPIIAVTTRSYKEDVDAAINSGMNYHLEKPVDPKTLLSAIMRFI